MSLRNVSVEAMREMYRKFVDDRRKARERQQALKELGEHLERVGLYTETDILTRDPVRAALDNCGSCLEFDTKWSEEDGAYVCTTESYPSLSWLAPTEDKAYAGMLRLVANRLDSGEP